MSKSDLNLSRRVNFAETVDILLNAGANAVHLTGEPGVGKTAMHQEIIARTG